MKSKESLVQNIIKTPELGLRVSLIRVTMFDFFQMQKRRRWVSYQAAGLESSKFYWRNLGRRTALLGCAFSLLLGCSSGGLEKGSKLGYGASGQPVFEPERRRPIEQSWIVWEEGPSSFLSKEGDRLYLQGRFSDALKVYRELFSKSSSPDQYRTALFRVVGARYALGQVRQALQQLGKYYRSRGISASEVGRPGALLFGYGYLLSDNHNQAISWFLKVIRSGELEGRHPHSVSRVIGLAEEGLARVVFSSTEQQMGDIQRKWSRNPIVKDLIARRRDRRPDSNSVAITGEVEPGAPKQEIAAILPMSGRYQTLGLSVRQGIELALSEGGLHELSLIDSEGSSAIASSKMSEFIRQESVAGILGPLLSDAAESVAVMIKGLDIPMIHYSKRDFLSSGGEHVFRLGFTPSSQALSLIEATYPVLRGRRIALLQCGGKGDSDFLRDLESELSRRNLPIAVRGNCAVGDTESLVDLAQEIEASDIDTLVFAGGLEDAVQVLNSVSRTARSKMMLLGGAAWYQPSRLRRLSKTLNGAVVVAPFNVLSKRPVVVDFIARYKEAYGASPDFLAAQAYDSAKILLRHLGPDQPATTRSFEGVTGQLRESPYGEIERLYEVLQLRDGQLIGFNEPEEGGEAEV